MAVSACPKMALDLRVRQDGGAHGDAETKRRALHVGRRGRGVEVRALFAMLSQCQTQRAQDAEDVFIRETQARLEFVRGV